MAWMRGEDRALAEAVAELAFCNPFLPERLEFEKKALGEDFVPSGRVWSLRGDRLEVNPNVLKITDRADALAGRLQAGLERGARPGEAELRLYEELVLFTLYHRNRGKLQQAVEATLEDGAVAKFGFFDSFAKEYDERMTRAPGGSATREEAAHLFACFFQIRRAFHFIFGHLIGGSMPAARLRASVWQSIFSHDMRRYRRMLFDRMGDVTCLITGPSGTGKELVARAIGLARYIPFDAAKRSFAGEYAAMFFPLNLSALAPTLIESELFGHCRGSFTGAVSDRTGWLEVSPPGGTVFLDEVGELDPTIQVKLLRVLQTRTFQRLGESELKRFNGKIVAATNRDLSNEMGAGRFREDFYYRLCSDLIETPTLREQLADAPEEMRDLVLYIVKRDFGRAEAEELTEDVVRWIEENLGPEYPWPGNVRELEQCVRNVVIRKSYRPARRGGGSRGAALARDLESGALPAEEILRRYCTLVYARTGSYQEAARRLGLDHRTVKARIDEGLLEKLKGGDGAEGGKGGKG